MFYIDKNVGSNSCGIITIGGIGRSFNKINRNPGKSAGPELCQLVPKLRTQEVAEPRL